MIEFIQVLIYGVVVGAVYGLVGLGFVLVFKITAAFNLAQGEMLMIMALICWSLAEQLGLPFILAILLTIVISVLLGYIIERLLLRPMVGQPMMSVIMMTLGLAVILKSIGMFGWGSHLYRYEPWLPTNQLTFGALSLSWEYLSALIIAVVLLVAFSVYFKKSKYALAMRAVGMNQTVAQAMGVRISSVNGRAWALAIVVAAIGGIILGTLSSVNYALAGIGLYVIPAIIIGGLTSISGAIIGGLIVGITEKMAAMYLGTLLPGFPGVVPYILALVILLIKPSGLWGEKHIERI